MFATHPSPHEALPLAGARAWSVALSADFARLGSTHYHADLFHFDDWMCRHSLVYRGHDRVVAERQLVERCRDWIARREQRPRRGDTDFHVLG